MFEYSVVSRNYLLILKARGWRLSECIEDELAYSGFDRFEVIIHNSGQFKDCITSLK